MAEAEPHAAGARVRSAVTRALRRVPPEKRAFLLGGLTIGALTLAVSWLGIFDARDWIQDFLSSGRGGRIFVDTPEVYTRERLVNDRFREDEWLTGALRQAKVQLNSDAGFQGGEDTRHETSLEVAPGSAKAQAESGKTAGNEGGQPSSPAVVVKVAEPTRSGEGQSDGVDNASIRARPIQDFLDVAELRRVVRDELLENQLDDRHDIDANTLLRLKFDASILPERGGSGWALVSVEVLPLFRTSVDEDGDFKEDLCGKVPGADPRYCDRAYDQIYNEWLIDMEDRVALALKSAEASFEARQLGSRRELLLAMAAKLRSELLRLGRDTKTIDLEMKRDAKRLADARHESREKERRCKRYQEAKQRIAEEEGAASAAKQGRGPAPSKVLAHLVRDAQRIVSGPDLCRDVGDPTLTPRDARADQSFAILADPAPDPLYDTVDLLLDLLIASGQEVDCPSSTRRGEEVAVHDFSYLGVAVCRDRRVERRWVLNWILTAVLLDEIRETPVDDIAALSAAGCESGSCEVRFCKELDGSSRECPEDGGFFDVHETREKPAAAEDGSDRLARFKARLAESIAVFSYAITPKTSAARIRRRAAELRALQGDLGRILRMGSQEQGVPIALKDSMQRDLTAVSSVPLIVGFSDGRVGAPGSWEQEPALPATQFGWFIGPEFNGSSARGEQQAKQVPLSALVSVPGWWNAISLKVEACWLGDLAEKDLPKNCGTGDVTHRVNLPFDSGAVSRALNFIIPREPYTVPFGAGGAMAGTTVELRAGHEGRILIEGQRLWRSTGVTLGAQLADSIEVLPNMEAIVARFNCVEIPSVSSSDVRPIYEGEGGGGSGPEGTRPIIGHEMTVPVTVWTSEGQAHALPAVVRVRKEDLGCGGGPVDALNGIETRLRKLEADIQQQARNAPPSPPSPKQAPPTSSPPPKQVAASVAPPTCSPPPKEVAAPPG